MTFTGFIGAICMFPLRAIINLSVALGVHPNVLTLIGVLINGLVLMNVSSYVQQIIIGVIIVLAVAFDQFAKSR